ncbi:hypothetical protein AKA01nite_03690 [Alkalibacterium kapii]|uniref:Uncharacterized protein n=1 Tax=Alkalibacterium kapii TaxID=426704 RepID=A0A511AYR2_9LACT|nr:hypothetical protein AKA01nite_03690 [Alkalibacterium kapii]
MVGIGGSWSKEAFIQALTYTPDTLNVLIYLTFGIGTGLIIFQIMTYLSEKDKPDGDAE